MPAGSGVSASSSRAVCGRGAQVFARRRSGDHCHAFLIRAPNLGRAHCEPHVRDRAQRHRARGAWIHDEVPHVLHRRGARVDTAHEHVDLLVLPAIARGDVAPHVADDAIGDVAHREPELRGALLIEQDLNLRVAAFDGRAHVAKCAARFHARAQGAGGTRTAARDRSRRGSTSTGVVSVSNAGRLNSYCTPGRFAMRSRRVCIARSSASGPAGGFRLTSSVPVFSPESTGFASRRLPVPATEYARSRSGSAMAAACAARIACVRGFERRARGQPQLHRELALRELRDQLRAQARQHHHGERERRGSAAPSTVAR